MDRHSSWSLWARLGLATLLPVHLAIVQAASVGWLCTNGITVNGDTTKTIEQNNATCYLNDASTIYSCKRGELAVWTGSKLVGGSGLNGRGDGCSAGSEPWKSFFRSACNEHDICYSTPGNSRLYCGDVLLSRMEFMCDNYPSASSLPKFPTCKDAAVTMATAVDVFAASAFSNDQDYAEDTCCNGNAACQDKVAHNRLCVVARSANDGPYYDVGRDCYSPALDKGTCQIRASSGYCDVPLQSNGTSCAVDSKCASGHCNGFCRECIRDVDCGSDKQCSAGFACVDKIANGKSCTSGSSCASGHCNGICRECTADDQCGNGRICDNTGFYCKDRLADGKSCSKDSECQSGRCSFFICKAQ